MKLHPILALLLLATPATAQVEVIQNPMTPADAKSNDPSVPDAYALTGQFDRIVVCGAISSPALASFPDKLHRIHSQLTIILADCRPACVAIENVFYSVNARSALKLGHARGVAMLAVIAIAVAMWMLRASLGLAALVLGGGLIAANATTIVGWMGF